MKLISCLQGMGSLTKELVIFRSSPQGTAFALLESGRVVDVDFKRPGPHLGDVYGGHITHSMALEGAFVVISNQLSVHIKDIQGKAEGTFVAVKLTKEPVGEKTWGGKIVPADLSQRGKGDLISSEASLSDQWLDLGLPLFVDTPELLATYRSKGALRDVGLVHSVKEQLTEACDPVVTLDAGGTIVIEQTQALIAIDVNLGSRARFAVSQTAILDCNLAAVTEIARHVRLRRLAGRIVIDFIFMKDLECRARVVAALKKEFEGQRANLIGFTKSGLYELTLKRTRRPLQEELNDDSIAQA